MNVHFFLNCQFCVGLIDFSKRAKNLKLAKFNLHLSYHIKFLKWYSRFERECGSIV